MTAGFLSRLRAAYAVLRSAHFVVVVSRQRLGPEWNDLSLAALAPDQDAAGIYAVVDAPHRMVARASHLALASLPGRLQPAWRIHQNAEGLRLLGYDEQDIAPLAIDLAEAVPFDHKTFRRLFADYYARHLGDLAEKMDADQGVKRTSAEAANQRSAFFDVVNQLAVIAAARGEVEE